MPYDDLRNFMKNPKLKKFLFDLENFQKKFLKILGLGRFIFLKNYTFLVQKIRTFSNFLFPFKKFQQKICLEERRIARENISGR